MDTELNRDLVAQIVLMGRELDRAEGELRGVIDRLGIDEQAALVAVMWVGRGAFEAAEWQVALDTAAAEATTPCADYILGTPHFTDHLEAGMEALGEQLGENEGGLINFA
ncbi:DUF3775 domain-containing protein [uncultured Tateyamaria sp.]|uniref:DUF3775 domain-containing protein n=1 Tax=Tateyamaria sp. 1078 TaxID=3417464 RepID=UPI0026090B7E|nr:DUF3775 domain-containing protein [uncultured Tateyamaria sp.]